MLQPVLSRPLLRSLPLHYTEGSTPYRHRRQKHSKSGQARFNEQAPKAQELRCREGWGLGGVYHSEGWVWGGGCAPPRTIFLVFSLPIVCFCVFGTLFGH